MIAVQFVFTLGVSYLLAIAQVFIRDTPNAWAVVTRIWFYTSPSLYALDGILEKIPEDYRWLYQMNPFATIFDAYRDVVIEGRMPDFGMLGYVTLLGSVILVGSMYLVRRFHGVLPKHV